MRIDEFNKIKNYIREKISRGIDVTTVAYNMSNIINFLHTCYESRLLKYDQYVQLVHFTVCYGNRIIDDLYTKRKCFIKGEEKK